MCWVNQDHLTQSLASPPHCSEPFLQQSGSAWTSSLSSLSQVWRGIEEKCPSLWLPPSQELRQNRSAFFHWTFITTLCAGWVVSKSDGWMNEWSSIQSVMPSRIHNLHLHCPVQCPLAIELLSTWNVARTIKEQHFYFILFQLVEIFKCVPNFIFETLLA